MLGNFRLKQCLPSINTWTLFRQAHILERPNPNTMERSYLQTIGLPIVTNHGQTMGRVTDIVLNTETGKVVGFLVSGGGRKVVSPIDILSWDSAIFIHGEEDVVEIEDVHQVKNALEKNIGIMRKRVVTAGGDYLGRVMDFSIENKFFTLTKLAVSKIVLGFIYTSRKIINAREIVEIKKDVIVVKNLLEPIKMKKLRVDMATRT